MALSRRIKIVLIVLPALIVLCVVGFYAIENIVMGKIARLPESSPARCSAPNFQPAGPVAVAIGDSITHATVSANYVEMLRVRPEGAALEWINAGINSELAYNALQRLDAIVACQPAYVTVLIGTNDVLASFGEAAAKSYVRRMKLPRWPDLPWYRENLRQLVRGLAARTESRIALLSLPVIGEEVDSLSNKRVAEYNAVVREVAGELDVVYLPLHERHLDYLRARAPGPPLCRDGQDEMYGAAARHYLLGRSWAEVAEHYGFHITTDCVHLSPAGAGMVADLIAGFLANAVGAGHGDPAPVDR